MAYSAFCDAVLRSNLDTRCYSIDARDQYADGCGETVFAELDRFNQARYAGFSKLLRCPFDEALQYFSDGTIDLLHINGRDTYEAVSTDFERWKAKCSDRAVVLLHGTNVRTHNFGIWKLLAELSKRYPHFEFLHEHGLGVIAVGGSPPRAVADLCGLTDGKSIAAIRERFALVGERWRCEWRVKSLETHVKGLEQHKDGLEQHIYALRQQVETLEQRVESHDLQNEAAQAVQAEAEQLKAALIGERQMRIGLAARLAGARKEVFEVRRAQHTAWHAKVREQELQISTLHEKLASIEGSTIWRVTWPLRRLGGRLPSGMKRIVQGSAKLIWWTVTLQLAHRLAARRRTSKENQGHSALAPTVPVPVLSMPSNPITEASFWEASSRDTPGFRRVIYISGEPDTPGTLYRVDRYIAAARVLGLDIICFGLDETGLKLPMLTAADIVVVWRAAWDPTVESVVRAARQSRAVFIFDLDDLVINPDLARTSFIDGIRSQGLTEDLVSQQYRRFHDTMLAADFCTATTETLAHELRQFHKVAFVLPNTFDDIVYRTSRFAVRWKTLNLDDGLIRIGYAGGSRTHQKDFMLAAAALADILRARPQCRLVLFRHPVSGARLIDVHEFPALQGLEGQIEWRDMVRLPDLPSELARFDINLAPLEVGNRFCEAKSELKFFEAAIAGVCTIASSTGPFKAVIRPGRNGYLADSPAQWTKCLNGLLDDPVLRRTMARQAHYDALAGFGPAAARQALASLLDQARSGERAARAFQLDVLAHPRLDRTDLEIPATCRVFASDRLRQSDVTVIVPLYNYASYIVEALESVRQQTHPDLDLVVVDDGSTDESLKLTVQWAKQHADRFNRLVILQNEQNSGLGPTRNAGFDAAETLYVLPLDADNRLLPDCCVALLRSLDGSGASFAYPAIRKFGGSTDVIGPSIYNAKRFVGEPYVDAMALVRKEAWAVINGYADMRTGWEDYDFWCRLAERGHWGIGVGEVLAEYRVHNQSMLATTTDVKDNKLRLLHSFEQRHVWVRVVDRPSETKALAAGSQDLGEKPQKRAVVESVVE